MFIADLGFGNYDTDAVRAFLLMFLVGVASVSDRSFVHSFIHSFISSAAQSHVTGCPYDMMFPLISTTASLGRKSYQESENHTPSP